MMYMIIEQKSNAFGKTLGPARAPRRDELDAEAPAVVAALALEAPALRAAGVPVQADVKRFSIFFTKKLKKRKFA